MFASTPTVMATLILASSTGFISVVAQSGTRPQDSFVLERGRAGQFEIGMTVDEVYQRVGRERVRASASFRAAEFRPALDIHVPGFTAGAALTGSIDRICGPFALWDIEVHDPRFRTSNGLGVGSTLGDVKRLYRGAKVTGIDTDLGAHVTIDELGMWFEMNPAPTFPDTTRITSVLVVPQPDEVRARWCPERPR